MAPLFAFLGLLGLLASCASATALTYKLPPNGKECFFSHVNNKGAKIAFYFAVRRPSVASTAGAASVLTDGDLADMSLEGSIWWLI